MKLILSIGLFLLAFASLSFSQPPDPRDSIILESKTVAPGFYLGSSSDTAAYLYIKVFITNKDSLSYMVLPLLETSISGGAYATLARPRSFLGMVSPLTNTLRYYTDISYGSYTSTSPDTFAVAAGFDGVDPSTIEPPNVARKAVWELKFDSVLFAAGSFELDSTRIANLPATFTTMAPVDLTVNFLKSIITVPSAPKGDLNWDLAVTFADVGFILNCVFFAIPPPPGSSACDLNCDGLSTPADIVLELNAVFLSRPFPC
ncbi:MAG TPA: hypothetical protein VNL73_07740 [Verrucomicrobiae bacterium]|nr:hypothetical protein [Verrucomicrobiae bacterium]